jgi:hypothetical protein
MLANSTRFFNGKTIVKFTLFTIPVLELNTGTLPVPRC